MRKGKLIHLLLIVFNIFPAGSLLAQRQENVWVFGEQSGLNFNSGLPVPIQSSVTGSTGEAYASVCNENGELLFYTEGSFIWDKNGNLMPNGSNLTGLIPANQGVPVTSSSSQGALIVPYPDQDSLYYVFSVTDVEMGAQSGRLYYSLVNMRLNNGLGDVVPGMKSIFIDSMLSESITATVGDRCNVWLISRSQVFQELRIYEITAMGLNPTPIVSPSPGMGHYMVVSQNRKQLVVNGDRLRFYNFDPVTGSASLLITLSSSGYGICFSSDDTKLYTSTTSSNNQDVVMYQYDMSSLDSLSIENSRVTIGQLGTFTSHIKRAVNGKLYFLSSWNSMGVINQPNLSGSACGFTPDIVSPLIGTEFSYGFPNVVAVIPHDTFLTSQQRSAGCFASQTLVTALDTSTGWDYVWNTGMTGPQLTADTPGTYRVTYHTPPCNYHVDTFQVDFPNGVLPTIYTMAECRSDSNGYAYAYTYPDDPVTYSYTWMRDDDTLSVTDTLSDVPSGSYSLHVQTNTGCDTLLFFDIGEEDFRVSFTVSDTLICVGDAIGLNNTSDAHFSKYYWTFGNGDTTDLPDPVSYVYPESGAYQLILSGEGAICKDTAYQTIRVDQPLLPAFEVEPQAVCVGQPVYFYPRTDSTTVQLSWEMEEQLRVESSIQSRYQHGFTSGGTFPVTLKVGSRACPDTSIMDSIRVYALPEVDLGSDSSLCLNGQPLYLRNLREVPLHPHHQVWSTGDTTEVLRVVHPGIYTLSVTMEPIGCTTTESIEITKDCYLDIPNAFTPNGDGNNDYFLPCLLLSESLNHFKMQIFNRWGQLLFETTNLNGRGWDGRFNDKVQPMGVYLYRIDADFSNGRKEAYKGNLTLLR